MTAGTLGFAFVAGILSALSPCVVPLLPIVLGTAAAEHRMGPVALAAGLALSFAAIGIFIATAGFALGFGTDALRPAAAILLVVAGIVLAVPALQDRVTVLASPISNWVQDRFGGGTASGLSGQFGVGVLLGAIWSPCVGPALGAASLLAAQGTNLGQVAVTMLSFGLGAAAPLLALGMLSRQALVALRGRMMAAGHGLKAALGVALIAVGTLVLTGMDKAVETALVDASPDWLIALTTRF